MGNKKIMVVEDERISLSLMEKLLVEHGYEVVSTQDGSKAVSLALKEKPDLIILDLGLPGTDPFSPSFDGYIVMDWLHRMAADSRTPIIVVTAKTGEEVRRRAMAGGAAAFFEKPARREDILAAIRIALDEGLEG